MADPMQMNRLVRNPAGRCFASRSKPIQAQKNESLASHPVSPTGLTGLPFAEVMLDSPGLVVTKIVLTHYTLPSPDPNLNDTFPDQNAGNHLGRRRCGSRKGNKVSGWRPWRR